MTTRTISLTVTKVQLANKMKASALDSDFISFNFNSFDFIPVARFAPLVITSANEVM